MPQAPLKNILNATFRANAKYELVLLDRLPPDQRAYLKDLRNDADFYGVFRPRSDAGLTMKSAPRDAALLYMTLAEPGPLPEFVRKMFGDGCNQAMVQLVLDSILEIESEGTFVTGSQAYPAIYEQAAADEAGGVIQKLSRDALRYAQNLEVNDSNRISVRLYFYNRTPASVYWRRIFPTREAVSAYLGIDAGGHNQKRVEQRWLRADAAQSNGWVQFSSRQRIERSRTGPGYKLYVSPRCEALRETFEAAVDVLASSGAGHFKIGEDLYGLLRPDKIVAYFADFEALQNAAGELTKRLDGCPAQGVPFTAELPGGGLLSWGADPPPEEQSYGWQARESWRLWVTNRLATALLAAKTSGTSGIEPWQFALERLRLENIDTDTWIPAAGIWRERSA